MGKFGESCVKEATSRKQNALLIPFFVFFPFGRLEICTKLSVADSLVQCRQKKKKENTVPFRVRKKTSALHIRPISESAAVKFRQRRPAAVMHTASPSSPP